MTTVDKTAPRDVRVFDGQGLTEPCTVVIDGAALAALTAHGVTTGLSMATWPVELVASMRDVPGLTDIRSAGLPAIGPGGLHARMPGLAEHAVVRDPAHARRFVADRVAEGVDYLKIMLEAPGEGGLPEDVAAALVAAVREHGLTVVAHAGSPGACTLALDVGADVITHMPLGAPVADGDVTRIVADGRVVIPTLDMMRGLAEPLGLPPGACAVSARGVGVVHAATSLPAKHFGLSDRVRRAGTARGPWCLSTATRHQRNAGHPPGVAGRRRAGAERLTQSLNHPPVIGWS